MERKTKLIDVKAVAEIFDVSTATIWRWSANGTIPDPVKFGGMTRWRLADIEAVIAEAA